MMGRVIMTRDMAGAGLALGLPLVLWAMTYPATDWAVLALLPLAVMMFAGVYGPARALNQARLAVVLQPGSAGARWMTGRLSAAWRAGLFTSVAVPVLAQQALVVTVPELICLVSLCLMAGLLVVALRRWLAGQMTAPFARWATLALAAMLAAVMVLPVLVWVNWFLVPRPAVVAGQSVADAMQAALAAQRADWVGQAVGGLMAADAARLWAVDALRPSVWPAVVYCLHAGLVGFVVARSFTALMDLAARAGGRT